MVPSKSLSRTLCASEKPSKLAELPCSWPVIVNMAYSRKMALGGPRLLLSSIDSPEPSQSLAIPFLFLFQSCWPSFWALCISCPFPPQGLCVYYSCRIEYLCFSAQPNFSSFRYQFKSGLQETCRDQLLSNIPIIILFLS